MIVGLFFLSPIIVYFLFDIFKNFGVKKISKVNKLKLGLFLLALFSDNIATLFLIDKKNNFENLYQFSNYASFCLILIGMMIPSTDLNIIFEILSFCQIIKETCCLLNKKSKIVHEMIPLNLSEIGENPNESFEQIVITNRIEEEIKELKEQPESNQLICIFTFIAHLVCGLAIYFDIFAKLKRLLSQMETPKLIDFLNYPFFLFFIYHLIGKCNKNLFIDKLKKIQQSKKN